MEPNDMKYENWKFLFNDDLFPEGMDEVRSYRSDDLIAAGLLVQLHALVPAWLAARWWLGIDASLVLTALSAGCTLPFVVLLLERVKRGHSGLVETPLDSMTNLLRRTAHAATLLVSAAAAVRIGMLVSTGDDVDFVGPALAAAITALPASAFGYRALQAQVADRQSWPRR